MSEFDKLPNLPDIHNLDLNLTDLEDLGISEEPTEDDDIFEEIGGPEEPTPSAPTAKPSQKQAAAALDTLLDEDFPDDFSDDTPPEPGAESEDDDYALDLDIDNLFSDDDSTPEDEEEVSEAPAEEPEEEEEMAPAGAAAAAAVPDVDDGSREKFIKQVRSDGPDWVREIFMKRNAQISHAFMLDFNVKDYAYQRSPIREILPMGGVIGTFDIILGYDLANGLRFWGNEESSRERFLAATGLDEKKQKLEQDELYQALNDTPTEEDNEPKIPDAPLDLFMLLAPLFKESSQYGNEGRILLYIDGIEMLLPDAPIAQMSLNDRKLLMLLEEITSSSDADAGGNCIIMVANSASQVHDELRHSSNRIEKVSIPLPSKEERLIFINEELIAGQNLEKLFTSELTPQGLGNLSAGLSKMQIEDIAYRADSENTAITEKLVRDRKTDIIKTEYGDVIEIIDSDIDFKDIGGMEAIKNYFMEDVITPIKSGLDELWRVPMGVMFLGPAGTGKTLLAQAVAKESQMNCVNLNIAKILNKYVGDSEKNFEKALQCIESMEPTIVIVEEIDNVFAGRGTDSSGVGGRLFKRFLEFMSDTSRRGKVIVIATSNYPSRMDAALKRPGRFDKKIPFLVPELAERLSIMCVLAHRKGFEFEIQSVADIKGKLAADPAKQRQALLLLRDTDGMTGAELETIIQKAITYAYKDKRSTVSIDDVYRASQVVIPSTSAIQEMTREALIECNDLEFIPEKYMAMTKELKKSLVEKFPEIAPGSVAGNG